jgi:formiminotetrahydrofolate cyclodeaminase
MPPHVPLHVAEDTVQVMELALKCAKDAIRKRHQRCYVWFLPWRVPLLTAAGYNVRININSLEDKSAGSKMLKELAELETKPKKLKRKIRKVNGDARRDLACHCESTFPKQSPAVIRLLP